VHTEVNGIILAGGKGQRVGGQDKGWVTYQGRPLIEQAIERLQPQVDRVFISANRNQERYEQLGHPVIGDMHEGFQGPLAGILAAGRETTAPWLLVIPCDLPQLPLDLCTRLLCAIQERPAQVALAHDGTRSQQLCLLLHRHLLDDISLYLARGERRVISWIEGQAWTQVDFSDQAEAFRNLNQMPPGG
jgi:molybdenum cofactor guanylyltransferase